MFEDRIEGRIAGLRIGDSQPVRIMGVINLTNDSFYSGSVRKELEDVLKEAHSMQEEGVDILDLGARSTAPYKKFDIPVSVEKKILGQAVGAISKIAKVPISADTTRLEPAKKALEMGATILNHVHGLTGRDSGVIAELAASKKASLLLTAHEKRTKRHRKGAPVDRIIDSLQKSLDFCARMGIPRDRITIDPGIGFFTDEKISNVEWNCTVLANLDKLRALKAPICVGLSRKRFLGQLAGDLPPEARLNASLGASAVAAYNGAHVIRTHDVKATQEAVTVAKAIQEKRFIP